MRILTVSTRDDIGGSARAAYRLHTSLLEAGVDAKMLVRWKTTSDPSVLTVQSVAGKRGQAQSLLGYLIDRRPLMLYPHLKRERYFSINWFPTNIASQIRRLQPDIVHLHGIGQGFVPVGALRHFRRPVVWTLHDVWPFTGGCYLLYGCTRYQQHCGRCPHLGSGHEHDVSNWNWHQKQRLWRTVDLTLTAPSRWLGACAKASSLLGERPIRIIPHGVNLDVYKPSDRQNARAALNLPLDTQLIVFGAVSSTSDYNKGFHLLQPALQQLAAQGWAEQADVVIFGHPKGKPVDDLGFRVHVMDYIDDEQTMAKLYAAANVLVIPSLQENFPQVVQEALACGTPCVGFQIGGIPDMVEHQVNGYLAQPYEIDDLARGIAWVLEDEERWQRLSEYSTTKITQNYGRSDIAQRYIALYDELLTARTHVVK